MMMRARRVIAALSLLAPSVARPQNQPILSGVVQDAATSRPIIGAIVTLGAAPNAQVTRTDGTGTFGFWKIASGEYQLSIRSLGFEPAEQRVSVDSVKRLTITMRRLAALDTVRIAASAQAIYGVVATAHDLKPLVNTTVQVFGTSVGQVQTDSGGRFFFPVRSTGPYHVRAKSPSGGSQTVSVTVERNEGVEVALLLDSIPARGTTMLEMSYADLRLRLMQRGVGSAIVPRAEILRNGNADLATAITMSPSFSRGGLRFSDVACVFVDGIPRPGVSLLGIDAAGVETVEVYAAGADRSGTLATNWPRGALCPFTGLPRTTNTANSVVRWVVIWLAR
jgi:hypothetical protein